MATKCQHTERLDTSRQIFFYFFFHMYRNEFQLVLCVSNFAFSVHVWYIDKKTLDINNVAHSFKFIIDYFVLLWCSSKCLLFI